MNVASYATLDNYALNGLIKLSDVEERATYVPRVKFPEKIDFIQFGHNFNVCDEFHTKGLLVKLANQTI